MAASTSRGPIQASCPATYSVGFTNNTGGVGSATNGLGANVKVSASPNQHLYVSASHYDSGDMLNANGTVTAPPLKVANLQSFQPE